MFLLLTLNIKIPSKVYLGVIQKERSLRRGEGAVIQKRTKTNTGRGVLACVYVCFLKKIAEIFNKSELGNSWKIVDLITFEYFWFFDGLSIKQKTNKGKQRRRKGTGGGAVKTQESWGNELFECPFVVIGNPVKRPDMH